MTELIWDGKYKDGKKQGPVRIALPFQTIETVNESSQERQKSLELFAAGRESEWRNRLIWGEKKYVLPSLLPEFAGKVNLIYIDPPFDTGADFSFTASIPEAEVGAENSFEKEPSIIEQKAYRDTWGQGIESYISWLYVCLSFLKELLAEDGSLFLHLDWHVGHYAKVVLDEVCGIENFRTQIIWQRTTAHANILNRFGNIHDIILYYSKGDEFVWNTQYLAYRDDHILNSYRFKDEAGRRFALRDLTASMSRASSGQLYSWKGIRPPATRCWACSKEQMGKYEAQGRIAYSKNDYPRLKIYLDEMPGVPLQDIWTDIRPVQSQSAERLDYPTQKPEALLERIIRTATNEGHLVLDCFAGSGTTAAVAEKLGRRWIACDLSRFAIHTTRKRLLGIPNVKPFVVQNLGKYERQAWQVAEFPANGKDHLEEQRQREAAYRRFILELYHAKPLTGHMWLHGTKGGRMVHVGAVDAPVTLADVKAIAKEAWKALGAGKDAPTKASVDIVGWEFAFELNETAKQAAAESRVDVTFKKIPREVLDKKAVEQGDVKFFELGALGVERKTNGREVTLTLADFVIPTDDIPEEARKAVKHWSQLIDYWAVDWDYKSDTFHNQWQTYRTRKNPKIELETSYKYAESGKYTIVVKVIDILGNDTTKTLEVKVKDKE
jgi:DNA modification methylase